MTSVRVYFVLYIVLLGELFLVILDRDEAQDAWVNQFKSHKEEYVLDFSGIKDTTSIIAYEQGKFNTSLYLSGMVSGEEKDSVKLKIVISDGKSQKQILGSLFVDSKNISTSIKIGKSELVLKKIANSIYELNGLIGAEILLCRASYSTKRGMPAYLPDDIKKILQSRLMNDLSLDDNVSLHGTFRPMIENKIAESGIHYIYIKNKNYNPNVSNDIEKRGNKKERGKK